MTRLLPLSVALLMALIAGCAAGTGANGSEVAPPAATASAGTAENAQTAETAAASATDETSEPDTADPEDSGTDTGNGTDGFSWDLEGVNFGHPYRYQATLSVAVTTPASNDIADASPGNTIVLAPRISGTGTLANMTRGRRAPWVRIRVVAYWVVPKGSCQQLDFLADVEVIDRNSKTEYCGAADTTQGTEDALEVGATQDQSLGERNPSAFITEIDEKLGNKLEEILSGPPAGWIAFASGGRTWEFKSGGEWYNTQVLGVKGIPGRNA